MKILFPPIPRVSTLSACSFVTARRFHLSRKWTAILFVSAIHRKRRRKRGSILFDNGRNRCTRVLSRTPARFLCPLSNPLLLVVFTQHLPFLLHPPYPRFVIFSGTAYGNSIQNESEESGIRMLRFGWISKESSNHPSPSRTLPSESLHAAVRYAKCRFHLHGNYALNR